MGSKTKGKTDPAHSKKLKRSKKLTPRMIGFYGTLVGLGAIAVPFVLFKNPDSPYYTNIKIGGIGLNDVTAFASENLNLAQSQIRSFVEQVADVLQIGEQCPYVNEPLAAVRSYFPTKIKGQEQALKAIEGAIRSWEINRKTSRSASPLVLAITGPTGVGKTETGHVLAEALLAKRTKLPGSKRESPSGLLIFRGEDFSDSKEMPLTRYHTEIKSRLVDHLRACNGNAIVLFDEIQKVVPGTLDILVEAMTEHPRLTYFKDGKSVTVDCSKVVFILISDIGWERMVNLQLMVPSREHIPAEDLRREVKAALDEQWDRLRFGKVVNEVIPYLPMEMEQLKEVLSLKLENFSKDFEDIFWRKLCVSPDTQSYLVTPDFILYKNYATPTSLSLGMSKDFAEYGARNIENAGPMKVLKNRLFQSVQPWRTDAIMNIELQKSAGKIPEQVRMSWCKVKNDYKDCPFSNQPLKNRGAKISWQENTDCELIWAGTLENSH